MSLETSLEFDVIRDEIEKLCCFSLGKQRIHNLHPSFDTLTIRQDTTRARQALSSVVSFGPLPLPGIRDISMSLENALRDRALKEQDFVQIIHFLEGMSTTLAYAEQLDKEKYADILELFSTLELQPVLLRKLQNTFNEYGEVKDNASAELRSLRNQLRHIDHEISSCANQFLSRHSESVVDNIVTTRNGRAVVLVKASLKNTLGGIVYGDSASGQASYVEPAAFVVVNNKKESLINAEREEIAKILRECTKEVGKHAYVLLSNVETLAVLDAIYARAEWGKQHDAAVADLTNEKQLDILEARHPLIDPEKVVANNYHIDPPHRVLLITGPNTGGKTVSMKVIGLFTLMTYAGIPVPCKSALIPFFDKIFVDIGDDQSVASSLSNFSAHMMKQATLCKEATADSLILLDEVGSGTDPSEGEALAIAILNDLREKQCLTVATTHYNRLKTYGKRHKDILLASVQFDMEKLTPTYVYLEGLTGQSNAFEVALKYGLPKSIVSYARFLKNQAKTQEEELMEKLEQQLQINVLKQQELDTMLQKNASLEKELEKKTKQLENTRQQYLDKAKQEAQEYLEQVKEQADSVLQEVRKKGTNAKYHEMIEERKKLEPIEEEHSKKVDVHHTFEVGDAVELVSSNQLCEVVKLEKKDVVILLNGRELRVKRNQIRPSNRHLAHVKQEPVVSYTSNESIFTSMPLECNLIGMHVDEALDTMDAYIDNAKVHNLKFFRIIHGDGSGALRKAVHKQLAKDSMVKSFRLGAPNEGGTGATVVTMK